MGIQRINPAGAGLPTAGPNLRPETRDGTRNQPNGVVRSVEPRHRQPPPRATRRYPYPHRQLVPVAYPQPHGPGGRARSRCRSRHDYFFGKYNAQLTRRTSLSVTRHDGSSLAGAGPALPGRAAGRPPRPTAMKALLLLHTQLPPHAILCLPCRGRAARGGHNMRPSIYRPDSSPFRLLGTTRRHLRPSPPLPPPRRWHRLQHRPEPGRC